MTNKTKQTAVDIAFEKLANQGLLVTKDYKNLVAYREAKEMEKGQTIMFGIKCQLDFIKNANTVDDIYNETYGGNK